MFRLIIICVCLAILATEVAHSTTVQLPDGFTLHPVALAWEEAYEQCQSKGATLASPVNEEVLNVMKSVMEAKNLTYHIGTRARSTPGRYVSIEGVALDSMSVVLTDMVQQLNPSQGDCLSMNHDSIRVVPCQTELPYICYNTQIHTEMTNCGPVKQGYKYNEVQRKCYKMHPAEKTWDEAEQICIDEGGHLVVLNDESEAKTIRNDFYSLWNAIWIGVRDYTGKGDWKSVHGQLAKDLYNVWRGGHAPATTDKITCAGLYEKMTIGWTSCTQRFHFICEK